MSRLVENAKHHGGNVAVVFIYRIQPGLSPATPPTPLPETGAGVAAGGPAWLLPANLLC